MNRGKAELVIVERLPSVGAWELYLFRGEETGETVCKVALRPGAPDGVEYGVFRGEDGEPSATGTLAQPTRFSDVEREDVLKELLTIYASKLPALRGGVEFDFYCERDEQGDVEEEDARGEDDDGADDDDDGEGAGDAEEDADDDVDR